MAAHAPPICAVGVEDADDETGGEAANEASGVSFGPDVDDAALLADGVAPVPVGRLLTRLTVSTAATIANTATRPITTHVIARRGRSGSGVIWRPSGTAAWVVELSRAATNHQNTAILQQRGGV